MFSLREQNGKFSEKSPKTYLVSLKFPQPHGGYSRVPMVEMRGFCEAAIFRESCWEGWGADPFLQSS